MNQIYTMDITLEDIHVNRFNRLKNSMLLYFAQEAAGYHCKILGVDWDTLAERRLFWALIRTHVEVNKLPVLGQTIRIETWPMPTTRSAYPRAMAAYDEEGQLLFTSTSLWVLMDLDKRTMVLPGKSGVTVEGILRGCEAAAPGSLALKELSQETQRTVVYSELDRNGHMNNTRYLDWVDDLIPSDFHQEHPVKNITLCYLSEAREAQNISLHHGYTESGLFRVDALRTRTDVPAVQERVFSAEIAF